MCSFMLGYHVHEKAILQITIPLTMLSLDSWQNGKLCFIFNFISNFSLLPLIPTLNETPIKLVLLLLNIIIFYTLVTKELKFAQKQNYYNKTGLTFDLFQKIYLFMSIFIQLFYSIIQPILFKKYSFLPLMLFSVYSGIGNIYCWYKLYKTFYLYYDLI